MSFANISIDGNRRQRDWGDQALWRPVSRVRVGNLHLSAAIDLLARMWRVVITVVFETRRRHREIARILERLTQLGPPW